MIALFLSLGLFILWMTIGYGLLTISKPRLGLIQGVLISPALGIAVTVVSTFAINRAGLPVKDFGSALIIVLVVLSCLIFYKFRPYFPLFRLKACAGILLIAELLAGWPMLNFGFDWIAFANDDMANYSLGAQRFLNNGFFSAPRLDTLFAGIDYSQIYWFMHAGADTRAGSELLLALLWQVTGYNAHEIYMPLILSLHLALVCATGAMVAGLQFQKKTKLLAMALASVSPLATLGIVYQLIAQVGGLALLCAALTLMCSPRPFSNSLKFFTNLSCPLIVFSTIFVYYPEVLPFFALGWFLFLFLQLFQNRSYFFQLLTTGVLVASVVLLLLNTYAISALLFMLGQTSTGMEATQDVSASQFPYFLIPTGLPVFWGLLPIAKSPPEPYVSIAIFCAVGLFFWLFVKAIPSQLRKVNACSTTLLVMLLMSTLLFYRNNDFGLFKLAMFAQPFLLTVCAIELSRIEWKRRAITLKVLLPITLVVALIAQFGYVGKSTGEMFGGLSDIPRGSALKVNSQFKQLLADNKSSAENGYIADTSNIVLGKFQALYTNGSSLYFPSRDFFEPPKFKYKIRSNENAVALELYDSLKKEVYPEQYIVDSAGWNGFNMASKERLDLSKRTLITTREKQTIFNLPSAIQASTQNDKSNYFALTKQPKNHLVFIDSELGRHFYTFGAKSNSAAFYQLADDPLFNGEKISALGERLVFLVLGSTSKPRAVMELTNTVTKQFDSALPTPIIQGSKINFVGRGSGRVFSEPLNLTNIESLQFISVDMNRVGQRFPDISTGLNVLFGRKIPNDSRKVTTFGRNISLVSNEDYETMTPPASLASFPLDLANKSLEYSGIYEDGWLSEQSFFVLSPLSLSKYVVVRGRIPFIGDRNFSTKVTAKIDGKIVGTKTLGLDHFELKIPFTPTNKRHRVSISFDTAQRLPNGDDRAIAAQVAFIGFCNE